METNVLPEMNMDTTETGCCPAFDPRGWDGRRLVFDDKPFVRATTRSLMHVPINMNSVFTRVQENIEEAGAQDPNGYLVLSHDLSASEGEHLFAVTKDVPGEEMTRLSGTFITRVFEGPYRHAKTWDHDMRVAAEAHGHEAKRVFMFYTTCPRCAKALGKNYFVGLAEI
ncbi:MAG: hydrolase [Pseudomonadota bacterium]